jgi:Double zinc ribbon
MVVDNTAKSWQLRNLIRVSISFVVTLIMLAIIRAVVLRLPHMDEMVGKFLTISNIVAMIISVMFIVVIIVFGKILAGYAVLMLPIFPGIGSLINNVIILIVIIIAYVSFDIVIMRYFRLNNIAWLYPIIFLILALIPIARIIYIFYTNSGNITYLFSKEKVPLTANEITCNNCRAINATGAAFCCICGEKIEKAEKNICASCGAELASGSSFCNSCGNKVEKIEKKESKNICSNCGAKLESGSVFCSDCGEKTAKG